MVQKFADIDQTVEEIVKGYGLMLDAPDQGTRLQARGGRITAEIARFLMEEMNRGTEPSDVIFGACAAFSNGIYNMLQNIGASGNAPMQFPGDATHSAVHVVIEDVDQCLHGLLKADRNGKLSESVAVDMRHKEVGDA